MPKQVILFLAANPSSTDPLALDEECAAIERELRMTRRRDDFELRSKWAVTVDEMMRHLGEQQPAVVHFSGHGAGAPRRRRTQRSRIATSPPRPAAGSTCWTIAADRSW